MFPLIVALSFDLIFMLPLSLFLLETGKHADGTNPLGKILRGTLLNPVVIGILNGVAASIS